MALELFGMRVVHPATIAPVAQADIVELLNMQTQAISNNSERWDWPNLTLENVVQGDMKVHAFLAELMASPRRVYEVDALQLFNPGELPASAVNPATTEDLTGGETEVAISFANNLTQAQADGFARRFFTFSTHKKLYMVSDLGVPVGSRIGTMEFVPNAQAVADSGATVNFLTPKASVMLTRGLPPSIATNREGFWQISADWREQWID